mmetsp:Transcript_19760/g.35128  ORF Transcript_19760/g.35128 Transcript_19760/m.35128 type:complete len:799 (+) Transcript_19760:72-2468(+)|eukprot:CAMPEP_0197622568 /NCGR_PEP_ID=MMETSP1338-20131121/2819_1 /TAXON_ID=43686 ORGANISM="Pelagodinium beii, Strain RCC1491" /NCGR_SAMPLE_ID=MMETSP1338 /ASSEMBLY_ACC=CAM_ASM_000754 /LENGTH=798 /DNA_ID=CAMNT_0043192309 /DNA_START=46 /DNA_END=2442 /DNA_ORIENTATION=-
MASLGSSELQDSVREAAAGSLVFLSPSSEQKKAKRWQDGWKDCKASSYMAWTYRDTPWGDGSRAAQMQKEAIRSSKGKSLRSATPSTRAPSRALASPDFRTPTPQSRSMASPDPRAPTPQCRRSPSPQTSQQKTLEVLSPRKPMTPKPKKVSPKSERKSIQEAMNDSLMESSHASSASVSENGAAVGRWMRRASEQGNQAALAGLLQSAAGVGQSELAETLKTASEWSTHQTMHSSNEVILGIEAAANAAGAKARGDVTLAIKARAVCRHNIAAATRKLNHLQGAQRRSQQEEDSDAESDASLEDGNLDPRNAMSEWVHQSSAFTAADLADRVIEHMKIERASTGAHTTNVLTAMLCARKGPSGNSGTPRRRRIEVLQNTTLGKMVVADPEKAQQHGLVAVPSWSHNKPWPPPPTSMDFSKQKFMWGGNGNSSSPPRKSLDKEETKGRSLVQEAVSEETSAKNGQAFQDRQEHVQVAHQLKDLVAEVNTNHQQHPARGGIKKGAAAYMRSQTTTDPKKQKLNFNLGQDEEDLNYLTVLMKTAPEKKAYYTKVFYMHAAPGSGYLLRDQLLRALRDVGLGPQSHLERQRLKEVQEKIVQDFRSDEHDWKAAIHSKAVEKVVRNPLTDRNGGWVLNEFLVMTSVTKLLSNQDQADADEALAEQLETTLEAIRDMKEVYRTATGDNKEMSVKAFVGIMGKAGLSGPRDEDLCSLLDIRHTKGDTLDRARKIDMATFVSAMLKVEEILKNEVLERELQMMEESLADGEYDREKGSGSVLDSQSWNYTDLLDSKSPKKGPSFA